MKPFFLQYVLMFVVAGFVGMVWYDVMVPILGEGYTLVGNVVIGFIIGMVWPSFFA